MFRIVRISKELRDSLEECLDRNDTTEKIRPYYLRVMYKNYVVLLPIRGNCPRSYSLGLKTYRKDKRRPGIDFSKMILLNQNQVALHTSSAFVDSVMMHDIYKKRKMIDRMVIQTIRDYIRMEEKIKEGKDLSSNERFLKKRSTLRNYHDILDIY